MTVPGDDVTGAAASRGGERNDHNKKNTELFFAIYVLGDDIMSHSTSFLEVVVLQWASRKKRISYDFHSYVGSTRHIPKTFCSAALSTATQPW
jgi:hypothetical protein